MALKIDPFQKKAVNFRTLQALKAVKLVQAGPSHREIVLCTRQRLVYVGRFSFFVPNWR